MENESDYEYDEVYHCDNLHFYKEATPNCTQCGTKTHCCSCYLKQLGNKLACWQCDDVVVQKQKEENYKIPPTEYPSTIKLGRVYKHRNKDEFNPNWLSFMFYFDEICVPTEMVISSREPVYPKQARSYITNLYCFNNKIYDRYELTKHIKDYIDSSASEIKMHEFWKEWFSDGHIEYHFDGFIFLTEEQYNAYKLIINENYLGSRGATDSFIHHKILNHIEYEFSKNSDES